MCPPQARIRVQLPSQPSVSDSINARIDNGAAFPVISPTFAADLAVSPLLVSSDMPSFYLGYEQVPFTLTTFVKLSIQLPQSSDFIQLPFFISDRPDAPDITLPAYLLSTRSQIHSSKNNSNVVYQG
jgi:hypothetical protein